MTLLQLCHQLNFLGFIISFETPSVTLPTYKTDSIGTLSASTENATPKIGEVAKLIGTLASVLQNEDSYAIKSLRMLSSPRWGSLKEILWSKVSCFCLIDQGTTLSSGLQRCTAPQNPTIMSFTSTSAWSVTVIRAVKSRAEAHNHMITSHYLAWTVGGLFWPHSVLCVWIEYSYTIYVGQSNHSSIHTGNGERVPSLQRRWRLREKSDYGLMPGRIVCQWPTFLVKKLSRLSSGAGNVRWTRNGVE